MKSHLRPRYHLHPAAGWMNDPNGAIQWNGRYHLFYQYNPYEAVSRNKHWGHVSSSDMIHWEEQPIALAPTPGGYDHKGCFSGTCVNNNGVPTILYTGVQPQVQCIATGSPDLVRWTRHAGNPVIPLPPEGVNVTGFRDPYVWREDGQWYMVIGSGIRGKGGAALLYRSDDLYTWQYLNPLYVGELDHSGAVWNCPNFFPLEDKHVLIVSGQRVWKPFFFTGTYQDHHFMPETRGLVDYGGDVYAPQVFFDQHGRCILWGWVWEAQPDTAILEQGWAGVMALPRLLSLRKDGSLASQPAPEVECLRKAVTHVSPVQIEGSMPCLNGDTLEIEFDLDPRGAARSGISVFCAPDGSEETRIGYDTQRRTVFIDRTYANHPPTMAFDWPNPPYHEVPVCLRAKPLRLRVFIDRSVIEVYTGDGDCLTSRVYPSSEQNTQVRLFAEGGTAWMLHMCAWELSL